MAPIFVVRLENCPGVFSFRGNPQIARPLLPRLYEQLRHPIEPTHQAAANRDCFGWRDRGAAAGAQASVQCGQHVLLRFERTPTKSTAPLRSVRRDPRSCAQRGRPRHRQQQQQQQQQQQHGQLGAAEISSLQNRELTPEDYELLLRLEDTVPRRDVADG